MLTKTKGRSYYTFFEILYEPRTLLIKWINIHFTSKMKGFQWSVTRNCFHWFWIAILYESWLLRPHSPLRLYSVFIHVFIGSLQPRFRGLRFVVFLTLVVIGDGFETRFIWTAHFTKPLYYTNTFSMSRGRQMKTV